MKKSKVLLSVVAGSLLVGGVTVGALSKDGKGLGEVVTEQLGNGGRLLSSFRRSGERVAKTNVSETFVKTADLMNGTKRMVFITAIDMDKDAEEAKYTRVVDGETKETPISTVYESVTIGDTTWYYDAAQDKLVTTQQDNSYYLAVYIIDVESASLSKDVKCFLTVNTDVTSDSLEVSHETAQFIETATEEELEGLCVSEDENGNKVVHKEHIDEDSLKGYCDRCFEDVPYVNGITLDYLTGYIGPNESVLLTAVVDAKNGASEEVEWHVEKSSGSSWTSASYKSWSVSDVFTLVDNEDGTATLTGRNDLYTNEFSCYVYATSKFDPSVSSNKTEKIYYQAWNATKRGTLESYFGSGKWNLIPFFPSCTLTYDSYDDSLNGYNTYKRNLSQMMASFENQGLWTLQSIGYSDATYTLFDGGYLYTCVLDENYYKSGKYYPEFTITRIEVDTTYPTSKVAALVADLGATGTVPAFNDGNSYLTQIGEWSSDPNKVLISCDNAESALDSYKTILEQGGWFLLSETDYALEGYSLIICPVVEGNTLVLELFNAGAPVVKPATSWPTEAVASAVSALGATGTVPALTGGTLYKLNGNEVEITADDAETIVAAYIESLVGAGWVQDGKFNWYYDQYKLEGSDLAIAPYEEYGNIYIDLIKLSAPYTTQQESGGTEEGSEVFPAQEVASYLTDINTSHLPAFTSGKFTITSASGDDVYVLVTESDITIARIIRLKLPVLLFLIHIIM